MVAARSTTRILKEVEAAKGLTIEKDGMLISFNTGDIHDVRMTVMGPPATPYEYVPFMFAFKLPDDYPFSPPVGNYLTNDGKCRFNPNLYTTGKICLSLLGTWSGPGWQPVLGVESVGRAIQGLVLTDSPLRNEPGHEGETYERIAGYSRVVEFCSLDFALFQSLQNPPAGCDVFKKALEEHFVAHMPFFMAKVQYLKRQDGQTVSDGAYGQSVRLNFAGIEGRLLKLYRDITSRDWTPTGSSEFEPGKRKW